MINFIKEKKQIISVFIVMILWGSLFPMVKMGFKAYNIVSVADILFFAGFRFTVCGAIISLYALFTQRQEIKKVRHSFFSVFLSGFIAISLHYGFTYMGLSSTDGSKTAILKQIGVLFYVFFSALFFKEDKLTIGKCIGVILGFFGVAVINYQSQKIFFTIWDLFIILASFCTVFSNVISKKVFTKIDPIAATGISQLSGGLILLTSVFSGGHLRITSSYFIIIYICIASVISYCLWYKVVKSGELSKLFIIKFAEPVFASLFGAFLLGENILKWQYLIAFLLIACGICVSNITIKGKSNQ